MSEITHNEVLPPPAGPPLKPLSPAQWQVWLVLLLAAASGYFSLSLHYMNQGQDRMQALVASMALVQAEFQADFQADRLKPERANRWHIGLTTLVPQIMWVVQDVPSLNALADALSAPQALTREEQLRLKQYAAAVLVQLQGRVDLQAVRLRMHTHLFYLSVVALVLAAVALLQMRRTAPRESALTLLLKDKLLFDHAPVALSVTDTQDRLLRVNKAFEQVTGFTEAELLGLPGRNVDMNADDILEMRGALAAEGRWVGEYQMRCKDGSVVADKVLRMVLAGRSRDEPEGFLTMSMESVISDDEKRLMLWQAHHDNLTKLPNANLLHERLARALIANQQENKHGALISIDLDHFQNVNDSVGHASADRVLTDAAYRIAMCARETDTVARMGGDLFFVVLHEIEEVAEAERMARAAVQAFEAPFVVEDREIFISASAGVVIFPEDGHEQGELLQKADAARMGAKNRGGNQIAFFEEQMNSVAARRLELETHLRRAVANNEFELYYQPVIDVSDDSVYGAEALLRWHSSELGFVSPGEFIPVAEETGLIVEIGEWVVTQVQNQLRDWAQRNLEPIRVSLNVSATQFRSAENAEALLALLARSGCELITIELTESALIDDTPGSEIFIEGLPKLGLHVALDDFGTGFSSVGYLRDFEFDVLKIDKSFIDSICEVRDHGLVASIVAMGRILGMRVIAEGVEDKAQLQQLRQIGCDYVQGFYFSKPLPLADFEAYLERLNTRQVAG